MGVLPHLKQSVCGLSLEAASKVIGFTVLALKILLIILITVLYLATKAALQNIKDTHQQGTDGIFASPGYQGQVTNGYREVDFLFNLIFGIVIGLIVFFALFDVLMLVGVHKRKASFICPWLVVQIITVCLLILNLFNDHTGSHVLSAVIFIACTCYFILIVNSHHTNLKLEQASSNTV